MQPTTERIPISTLLAALGRDATARVRRAIRPLDVAAQQFLVLSQLRVLGEASQAELADAAGIDRSNLATLVNELCERELVARTRHELDRRRYVLRLSARGERLLRRTDAAIAAAENDLLSPLDDTQRAQLSALLRRLADGVELCPTGDDTTTAGRGETA